jgi:hypothetical protein
MLLFFENKLACIAHNVLVVYDVAGRQPGGWQCGGVFAWERATVGSD